MPRFDTSQQRVLALDPTDHARVVGAPGSGKTLTLVESFARVSALPGWSDGELLVLAPNRLVASQLRAQLERRLGRALGGTPVRTAASFAFSVLARASALRGEPAPRLLTGTVHDEALAEQIERGGESGETGRLGAAFAPEVLQSAAFRAELRELWRVLDDFALAPEGLSAELVRAAGEAAASARTRAPQAELVEQWVAALGLIRATAARMRDERPGELTTSGMLRAAAETIGRDDGGNDGIPVPRLVLVDDAQELGEGELALLAACASRGSRVWVFGDPDIATGAFHGERTDVLARLASELERRGAPRLPGEREQEVVLGTVHRHGEGIRAFVREITERIGAAGAGAQRAAEAEAGGEAGGEGTGAGAPGEASGAASGAEAVQFATVPTLAEQLGVIAHRLRRRRLGLDTSRPLAWERMAVICRSRREAARAARVLAGHQVPTGVAAGGLVLREHQVVRELIRLLQHALGLAPLEPAEVLELAGGVVGGLDPIALRRLRGALRLQENREARAAGREPGGIDGIVAEAFGLPGAQPVVDSAGGRALRRLGRLAAAGVRVRENGGTARETLWEIWNGTGLAGRWQEEALDGRGSRSDDAHRALDAVLGLFFALQRHEEQDSELPVSEVLDELLASTVPEDTLAARSERGAVTVTTPQGAIGREYDVVCLLGPQDGVWPNLRARGSLLGVTALERWLRGGEAAAPSRRDTLHDELRLFAHSCARARGELLAVAVADEDHHPSSFFGIGRRHEPPDRLPSSRLTLRGAVAEMRRRLTRDPDDRVARDSLAALARAEVPGARPDEWYGVQPTSTEAPLVDLDGDPEARVKVSPSQLETAERCPLDWAISRLGGGTGGVSSALGTLLHRALEEAEGSDPEALLATVASEWSRLPFDAEWEAERTLRLAEEMVRGLSDYLREFEASGRELVGTEAGFSIEIGRARLAGIADRLEARALPDGRSEISVVDLKTGKHRPTAGELEQHAQLRAYQLGVIHGAFDPTDGADIGETVNGGARLLYVHPDAVPKRERARSGLTYTEAGQALLDPEAQEAFANRVADIARVMAGSRFTARIEHHCSNAYSRGGSCRLHVIPAVSRA
ncbi:PD-(D/E)XK nuclease family protein [Leucobacter sp. CSA1]|uniref:DNA 3'-5' helicase n=1 Tax=Leucobacter chromiisoli TaxID=2796471 RepID=A0A934Q9H5_9MICO|nr:PD-(D/E)XK nuclease family protein [Leucobacter chromiisoli]MBK0419247.1 PD-(D/E)XK nuclease family protein [Leucobacter chromiisoli]